MDSASPTKTTSLPPGWTWTTLGEIGEVNPKVLPIEVTDELEVSFLPMRSVEEQTGRYDLSIVRMAKEVRKGYTPLADGDLIFAKITPCMENGKVAVLSNLKNGVGFGSTEFHVLRFRYGIERRLFFHFLLQQSVRREARRNMSGSAGQLRVPSRFMIDLRIPLPPLPEQHRIVEKIEALLSELDKGVEQLKTAAQQLKVYRQSVLKWAFEGRLTEQWRNQKSEVEGRIPARKETSNAEPKSARIAAEPAVPYTPSSAAELLARIKQEREAQAKATGKKLKPIAPLTEKELAELPSLPEGWAWVRVQYIAEDDKHSIKAGPFGSSLKKESYARSGYKIYGQEQVISGDPHFGDYFIGKKKYEELKSCKVNPGDVLISLVGTIGKVLILPDNAQPGIINPRLVKISLNRKLYSPVFFKQYFESTFLRSLYALRAHGATMDVLNLGIIRDLPFPFCSLDEQNQIVQEIESRLSVCDKLEDTITASLQQAEALRQSILKKAFEGKLVAQDPNDPPASELLEKIKAEKAGEALVGSSKASTRRGGRPSAPTRAKH